MTDSENARLAVMNPLDAVRTRCLDIRYKWIIEKTKEGLFTVDYLKGTNMAADGLTKPLESVKHARFVKMLGIVERKIQWKD